MSKIKVLAVVGPTASGKTRLSVELAKKYNGEIVSADSMQIYKNMQIATAKPTDAEKEGIPHHLIDFLSPGETYSVGDYVIDAQQVIDDIVSRGKLPIICGGTGLYVDSLLNGLSFTENSNDDKLREDLNVLSIEQLLAILEKIDKPTYEKQIVEKNKKRIIRAIEFYETAGYPISKQSEDNSNAESRYDSLIIGLTANDRQYLYDRINLRVDFMIKDGLVDEARDVFSLDLSRTSKMAIGYKELKPYFDNEQTLEYCVDRLKTETRHYAKRQLTWFRRNSNINWINIDEFNDNKSLINYVVDIINKKDFLNG